MGFNNRNPSDKCFQSCFHCAEVMHYIHHTCPSIAPFPPPALDGWLREPSVLPPLLQQTLASFPSCKNSLIVLISKTHQLHQHDVPSSCLTADQAPPGALSLAWTEDDRSEASEESFGLETNPPEAIRHRVSVELQVEQGKVVRQVPQKEHRFPVHSNCRIM